MTLLLAVLALLKGCPLLVGGVFDDVVFLASVLCLMATLLAVGVSASDRSYPGVLMYVIGMTLYLYHVPEVSEHLNAVTPQGDTYAWAVIALYAVLIPGALFCAPMSVWLFDTSKSEQE